jgi:hypothetical protein
MAIKMEDKVEVSLTVGEWNRVIDMLGDHPFKQSAAIIGQITQQVQAIISASTASLDEGGDYGGEWKEGKNGSARTRGQDAPREA